MRAASCLSTEISDVGYVQMYAKKSIRSFFVVAWRGVTFLDAGKYCSPHEVEVGDSLMTAPYWPPPFPFRLRKIASTSGRLAGLPIKGVLLRRGVRSPCEELSTLTPLSRSTILNNPICQEGTDKDSRLTYPRMIAAVVIRLACRLLVLSS